MTNPANVHDVLQAYAHPEKALLLARFFKTGPGQYGEGDIFLGITVPECRKVARQFHDLSIQDIDQLLDSDYHEERLVAVLILVAQYKKAGAGDRRRIYEFYLAHSARINNWDLVDLSCRDIVGWETFDNPDLLPKLEALAGSSLLWDRRIAVISTFYFLMKGEPEPTLAIVGRLLGDNHDLIQKACGWMLRELGKRISRDLLLDFIRRNYDSMPRTTLRYAIEHFSPAQRKQLLAGDF